MTRQEEIELCATVYAAWVLTLRASGFLNENNESVICDAVDVQFARLNSQTPKETK